MAKYLSRVKLADGSAYEIKDSEARAQIELFLSDELVLDCGGALEDDSYDYLLDCGSAP